MITKSEQQILDNIEADGFCVIHVTESFENQSEQPGFSYSIGLFKNYQLPEVLIIGLDQDLRHTLMNNICAECQEGNGLKVGDYNADIVENFDCLVVSVEKDHFPEYLGWARWYYKGDQFPAVQVVYPSLLGLFPWDKDFPRHIIQPMLGSIML